MKDDRNKIEETGMAVYKPFKDLDITAHCTLNTAHCTLRTAHCTLHTAHCALHTAHCTLSISVITRQAMYVLSNIEARSLDHCCRGEAISITHSECRSVALAIQHAKRMRRIILSSVVYLALQYFSHYLINGTIFGKKRVKMNTKRVFRFSLKYLPEAFFIL
jgi:hypothetical protein